MFEPIVYFIMLALCCGYALLKGSFDARVVASLCIVGTMGTLFSLSPLATRYTGLETGALIVDVALLGGFVAVALHSRRFWPLWIAGLQLTSSMAHLFKAIDVEMMSYAYGVAMAFWSYPILIILAIGTWRSHHRTLAQLPISSRPA